MNEKIEAVSGFGIYTVVKLTQLDEEGNEILNGPIQYAVMASGVICYGPINDIKAVMKWAKEHKDDTCAVVEEVKIENEEEAAARGETGDTSLRRPGD
jgi:hypothetical protein